ncbi:carbohydrate kinase family protein [Candidatus Saccharibacteria bacterium CG_4_10_14_0_2_um_filter_52_9]|nr:MAG: carbohydrate kinase family protein [Candidatus Saccharibacteria bacterium CG_4_10_14_0_2_um_filter_52_9]
MSKPQVIISGSIAIDRIMNFTGRYRDLIKPDKLHVLSLAPLLDKLENSQGGVGANIAYNLALLGEEPVLLGSVGSDAADYIKLLESVGVDASDVHISKLPTASFNVITDSEGSQVGGFYPGAMADSQSLSFKPWQGQSALAVISAHDPKAMNRQVEECQTLAVPYAYDPGQQTVDPTTDLKKGIGGALVVVANDYEIGSLCDRLEISVDDLKNQVPVLITTLGTNGSLIEGTAVAKPLQVGIAKPREVVDPTGAGDAYRAGFLYGYLRQWDLEKCGKLGAVVASFVVEKHGTQVKFSTGDVVGRYKDNFNEEIEL